VSFSLSAIERYRSQSYPELELFYKPMGRRQQKHYRRRVSVYGDPLIVLKSVLVENGVLVRDRQTDHVMAIQKTDVLSDIPEDFIFEAGAVILGWRRDGGESKEAFMDRVRDELMEVACDVEEGI
jgi:hypothetical protein